MRMSRSWAVVALVVGSLAVGVRGQQPRPSPAQNPEAFRFKSGVDLVNVTATVSDENGRFVSGLRASDFTVYEDDRPQTVTQFSGRAGAGQPRHRARHQRQHGGREDRRGPGRAEPIPLRPARQRRRDLPLSVQQRAGAAAGVDEGSAAAQPRARPDRAERWHGDVRHGGRGRAARAGRASIRKKALVVISDGNDTSSRIGVRDLKQLIRRERSARLRDRHRQRARAGAEAPAAAAAGLSRAAPLPARRGRAGALPPPEPPRGVDGAGTTRTAPTSRRCAR